MATLRHGARPGLREVWALWGLYCLLASAIFATYARLPVNELYHVSTNGRGGGAERALVFLNYPTALAAIAIAAVVAAEARSRAISRLAVLAIVLCAAVFWPGVVDQADLDAKWTNAIAASGVLLTVALTISVFRGNGLGPRARVRGDGVRVVATLVLALLALPWIVADFGFLIGNWPVLGSIFYSDEWHARLGHARLHRAVHAGHHHGMDGTLLALTAIWLSRTLGRIGPTLRGVLGAYLALLLVYGLANDANDFWLEQLVKRGITSWEVPSMLVPSLNLAWLVLLVLAVAAYVLLFRHVSPGVPAGYRRLLWPAALQLAVAALLVVGLLHGAERHVTRLGSVDGIAFASAPAGSSHIFVTRGSTLVQLTDGDDTELAPAWSPDSRRIAFQSNRDGNWELYLLNADGSGLRRLTDDDAADGEPSWSPDGKRIAFVHRGDAYVMQLSGGPKRKLEDNASWPSWSADGELLAFEIRSGQRHGIVVSGESRGRLGFSGDTQMRYPSWSPKGKVLAYECLLGGRWHICTSDLTSRSNRVLTRGDANEFAPAWSPDGSRIAFISDRDGNDQLYVMHADGTRVVRVTSGQAEKDTPAWRR